MNKMTSFFVAFGRYTLALALVAFSVQQFQYGSFRPVVLPHWEGWPHGYTFAAYAFSALMLAGAIGLLFARDLRRFSAGLGTAIFAVVVVLHLPYELTHNMSSIGPWTNTFKALAFSGCAYIIASAYPVTGKGSGLLHKVNEYLIRFGPAFLGIFLVVCCVEHFVYIKFVATLVPDWMPWHYFWSYFAAIALLAAGIALIFRIQVFPAAALLGIMLFLWVFMVHLPRAIAMPNDLEGNEITSVFQALAYSGVAMALAALQKKKA